MSKETGMPENLKLALTNDQIADLVNALTNDQIADLVNALEGYHDHFRIQEQDTTFSLGLDALGFTG